VAGSPATLAKSNAQNRREWPRYPAERAFALAATIDGRLLSCQVADISLGGAKLVFDEPLPAGTAIVLNHPEGQSVTCARIWQDAREVGVEFDFSEDSLGLISVCIRNMIDLEPPTGA